MSKTTELEKTILGAGLSAPRLLRIDEELTRALFSPGNNRKIFSAISEIVEDNPSLEELPIALVAEKAGLAASVIADLVDGLHRNDEAFRALVNELISKRKNEKFIALAEKAIKDHRAQGDYDRDELLVALKAVNAHENGKPKKPSRFVEAKLSDVEEEPIVWLWEDVLPIGMLSIITGNPSVGKTFTAAWIASRLSYGKPFPGRQTGIKGETLYLTRESPQKTVLKPRLVAAGADCSKITHVQGIYDELGQAQVFDIGKSLPLMEQKLSANPEIRLIIIDPIISFMDGKTDTNNPNQVRHAMDVLAVLADKWKIAIVIIMHLNKNMAQDIIQRNSGSIQFMAAAQVGWVVGPDSDPDHKFRKLMMPAKNNLAPMTDTWAFDVEAYIYQNKDGKTIETGRAVFLNEPKKDVDVAAIISPYAAVDPGRLSKMKQAKILLINEVVKGGPKDVKDLERLALDKKIGIDTLQKAKQELEIDDTHVGTGKGSRSVWFYEQTPAKESK